jgi:hypothetical protein
MKYLSIARELAMIRKNSNQNCTQSIMKNLRIAEKISYKQTKLLEESELSQNKFY